MNLCDIFCQSKAVNSLERAFLANKIPHAYIFAGMDGVGKFTTAKYWAKLLLCDSPVTKNNFAVSCDNCPSCTAIDSDCHPDFHHIYKELIQYTKNPQNRKKTPIDLPIAVVKEFFLEKVQKKPMLSDSKIFVISESEKLNTASQNAILKVLEEPPGKSFIILLCTKLDNLLPTTKSRCQTIRFGPISEEKIIEYLAGFEVDSVEAKFLARFSGHSFGTSELLSKLEPSFYKIKKQMVKSFCQWKLTSTVDFAQWINSTASQLTGSWEKLMPNLSRSDISRQTRKLMAQIVITAASDAMKLGIADPNQLIHFDQAALIGKLAQKYEPSQHSRIIENCFKTSRFIDASVNDKLIFEHMLLNLANTDILNGF